MALPADAPVDQWHHNFNLVSVEGRAALINASNVPDWIPSDGETLTLDVIHYLCYPDEYLDRKSGEIVQCTSVVLVGKDGRTAKFRNDWSLRRIHAAMLLFTPEEWNSGVKIECYSKPSREPGKRYGSFRVITQSPKKSKS